jgi:hypothetical protein
MAYSFDVGEEKNFSSFSFCTRRQHNSTQTLLLLLSSGFLVVVVLVVACGCVVVFGS